MSTSDLDKQLIPRKPSDAPGADDNPFLSNEDVDAELEHAAQERKGDDSRSTSKGTGDDTTRNELGDVAHNASVRGWGSLRKSFTGSRAKGRSSTLSVLAGVPQERPADARTRRGTVSECVDAVEQDNVVGGEQCMSRRTTATDAKREPKDKRVPDFMVLRETAEVEQHDATGEKMFRDNEVSSGSG